jgi:hypothetical protein
MGPLRAKKSASADRRVRVVLDILTSPYGEPEALLPRMYCSKWSALSVPFSPQQHL